MRLPPKTCDCGNAGVKKDGSGWFCLACERMVEEVTKVIGGIILEQRAEINFDKRIEMRAEKYNRWKMKEKI